MSTHNVNSSTEIAILLDDYVNKFHPVEQLFKLQMTGGMQNNSRALYRNQVSIPNLMNKETEGLEFGEVKRTAVVKLALPREVTRTYPKKYIPVGTRFIVTFLSGDITKPQIIGMEL